MFQNETEGYSVFNLRAPYVWPQRHTAHILSFTGYNLTNAIYRNHTSFIKDQAPEIGRGIRLNYAVRSPVSFSVRGGGVDCAVMY